MTGTVKTTPITAMLSYTSDSPIFIEAKKQAIGIFLKMKALHEVQWINKYKPSIMKIYISSLEV